MAQNPLRLAELEKHALALCDDVASRDSRVQAFTCYLALREKICTELLPLISSKQPYINDHTRSHLLRVLRHIEGLLVRHFPNTSSSDVPITREVSWIDAIVLLNALVWHDLGNVRGREGHAKEVHALFGQVAGHLYDDTIAQFIRTVAEAHSGEGAIETKIPLRLASKAYHGGTVNQRFLAAVLRFADELDEDHERIPTTDYVRLDLVPQQSQRYWFFNKANESIRVVSRQSRFGSYDSWVEVHSRIPSADFERPLYVSAEETTPALTEYFRRLLKIEKERRYCNQYMRSAYNHSGVAGLSVTLDVNDSSDVKDDMVLKFDLTDDQPAQALLTLPELQLVAKFLAPIVSSQR